MGTCFCQTGPYKEHFVCFTCRKMFKKQSYWELPKGDRPVTHEEYRPSCPQCGEPMHNMGKEFKPPRQRAVKAWRDIGQRHEEIQKESLTSLQSEFLHGRHNT